MNRIWILCCGFFISVAPAFSQATGLLVSNQRYMQVPQLPTYSGAKYTEVPVKVSLKRYCPVPADQQKTGTCVGYAIGYGALTIQRAIQSNATDQAIITQQANSAAFLYNQVRQGDSDCMGGAFLEDALELLKQKGDCLEKSFSYAQVDCYTKPESTQFEEASKFKVSDFAAVFGLEEDAKSKIGKACKILATNTPLVVGMGVTSSFFEVLPGAGIWDPAESETITGYHAMVLVGYNNVEKYFDFMNSFGASWGQNGFIRVPYADFERLCRYAYVIIPDQIASDSFGKGPELVHPVKPTSLLSGSFVFRQPAGFVTSQNGEELMYFEEVKAKHSEQIPGFYTTEQKSFEVGDVFQLVARDVPRGCYVYVFSQSADGSVQVHFPRKNNGQLTAGFVLEKTVEVVIPGDESLLQLPALGEDYLCILYSRHPIQQFDARMKSFALDKRPFLDKYLSCFSGELIPPQSVQYAPEKMAFSVLFDPEQPHAAVGMVLRVLAF